MRSRGRSILCRLGLIAVAVLLAACHTPSHPPPGKKQPDSRPPARTGAKAPPAQRGGGYYKDDGPGDAPTAPETLPDALPRTEPLLARANRPYRALGKTYTPRTRLEPYRQRGVASWYGRRFHGKRTSSGEVYNMYAMSAAHPTLPIPSYARVTAVSSGHSVVVRINDRGPFLHGRIIDLSYAAASKLGYVNKGSAEVVVEQILPGTASAREESQSHPTPTTVRAPAEKATPPVAEPTLDDDPIGAIAMRADITSESKADVVSNVSKLSNGPTLIGQNLFLQLGVFVSRENAEDFRTRIALRLPSLLGQLELVAEGAYFRLYAGPYASPDDARAAADWIGERLDIQPFITQRGKP